VPGGSWTYTSWDINPGDSNCSHYLLSSEIVTRFDEKMSTDSAKLAPFRTRTRRATSTYMDAVRDASALSLFAAHIHAFPCAQVHSIIGSACIPRARVRTEV
jgi:hypothetical protein